MQVRSAPVLGWSGVNDVMRGSPVEFKTVAVKAGESAGEFVGYASTWTRTPDSYGDVVAKGAVAATLAD